MIDKAIVLVGAASVGQAITLVLLLLNRAPVNRANYWLSLCLASISLVILGDILLHMGVAHQFIHTAAILTAALLLIGPTFWLYVRGLTRPHSVFRKRDLVHFIPFLLWVLLDTVTLALMTPEDQAALVSNDLNQRLPGEAVFSLALLAIQSGAYIVAVILELARHRRGLVDQFSNIDHRSLRWVTHWVILLAGLWLIWVVTWALPIRWANLLTTLGYALCVGWAGYKGVLQGDLFATSRTRFSAGAEGQASAVVMPDQSQEESTKYARSGLGDRQIAALRVQLESVMETQKPFLDEDLALADLAELIDATPHQLSQLLNQHLGVSFYDFINRERVAAVKRCLNNPAFDNQPVLDIGLSCGFGSKATFNAIFKRLEGITPSEYRRGRSRHRDVESRCLSSE